MNNKIDNTEAHFFKTASFVQLDLWGFLAIDPMLGKRYVNIVAQVNEGLSHQQFQIAHEVREILNNILRKYEENTKNEVEKIKEFVLDYNNHKQIIPANIKKFKELKEWFTGLCHANSSKSTEEFLQKFKEFEKTLLEVFGSFFIERRNEITTFLNQKEQTNKIPDNIINALQYTNLQFYFFDRLCRAELFDLLLNTGDLLHPIVPEQNEPNVRCSSIQWPAFPYLVKVISTVPNNVFKLLDDILKKIRDTKEDGRADVVVSMVLQLASKFEDELLSDIGKTYNKYIVKRNSTKVPLNIMKEFFDFITKLHKHDKMLSIKIFKNVAKYHLNWNLLRYGKNLFCGDDFCDILYWNIIDGLNVDKANCDIGKQNIQFALTINSVKGNISNQEHIVPQFTLAVFYFVEVMEQILSNDCNKLSSIIKKLEAGIEKPNSSIFKRLLLHILKHTPDDSLIGKLLVDESNFMDHTIHHEYYLLLEKEFKNLEKKSKDKILEFIKNGPNIKLNYLDGWKLKKLHCIRDGLSGKWKEEYEKLYSKLGEPTFKENICIVESSIGFKSPKSDAEFKEMSVDEIIKVLIDWEPPKQTINIYDHSKAGLGQTLLKDFENNPSKYIDHFSKFNTVFEPTYIRNLFYGIVKDNSILSVLSNRHHTSLIKLALWAIECKEPIESSREHLDEDNGWEGCYKEIIRFVVILLEDDKYNKLVTATGTDILKIITTLIDRYKSTEVPNNSDTMYFQHSMNSVYGVSLDAFISCVYWGNRTGGVIVDNDKLIEFINRAIKEKATLDFFSVIGRHLPLILSINKDWFISILEDVLPEQESKIEVFKATWFSYLRFSEKYTAMLEHFEKKIVFIVDKYKLFQTLDRNFLESVGGFIANYIVCDIWSPYNTVIVRILEEEPFLDLREGLFSCIGSNLNSTSNKMTSSSVTNSQKVWDTFMTSVGDDFSKYKQELLTFCWWYRSPLLDREWALNNLNEIMNIIDPGICLYDIEEMLVEDARVNSREVFEILFKIIDKLDNYQGEIIVTMVNEILGIVAEDTDLSTDKKKLLNSIGEKFGNDILQRIIPS